MLRAHATPATATLTTQNQNQQVSSLFHALLLCYVPHVVKIPLVFSKTRKYDVRNTRVAVADAMDSTPEGRLIARAQSAHLNALENYPLYAAAVLAALHAGAPAAPLGVACSAYLALRVLYTGLFLAGSSLPIAYTRSLTWLASMVVIGSIFASAATAAAAK